MENSLTVKFNKQTILRLNFSYYEKCIFNGESKIYFFDNLHEIITSFLISNIELIDLGDEVYLLNIKKLV